MANSYKNIIITPNTANTAEPKIEFRGGNTTVNTAITVQAYPTSNGTMSFEGTAGQLFSVTNDMTGSIFSVNDVSGIPSIEVFANGQINLGQYGGNVAIGTTIADNKLTISVSSANAAAGVLSLVNPNNGVGTAADLDFVIHSSATLATGRIRGLAAGADNYPMSFWTYGTSGIAERMRIGNNGCLAIGSTSTDATIHIGQALGGYNRFTQMNHSSGTSVNAFNIMAAKNSGGTDTWWSWGVRNDSVWAILPGVDGALNPATGIYFDSACAAYKPGGGSWSATSDLRVKTNVVLISDAANRIMALKPSSFDYRAPEAHAGRISDRGFIAQDFEKVYPHGVSETEIMCEEEKQFFAEGETLKSVALNNDFFADLVALVQEQQTTINDLRARVAQLEGN